MGRQRKKEARASKLKAFSPPHNQQAAAFVVVQCLAALAASLVARAVLGEGVGYPAVPRGVALPQAGAGRRGVASPGGARAGNPRQGCNGDFVGSQQGARTTLEG